MQGRSATSRLIAVAAVVVLLWTLPIAAAQTAYDARTGAYDLGPGFLYHPFLFKLVTSDLVLLRFHVAPLGAETVFTFHLHVGASIITLLNITTGNYSSPFNVPNDGFYAPQWVNANPFKVNVTYAIYIYHNGVGLSLPNIPTPLLLLVGGLGGAAGGTEAFLWFRKWRQSRHA